MLGKLMKHEFRATGRVALPLCGVMLALSLIAGMTMRFWDGRENSAWWEHVGALIILLYSISLFAVGIGIFILLMQHFKRNLLGDEGYLMRTLPVSVHELLLSTLFVALLWYIAAGVLIMLSFFFLGLLSGQVPLDELDGLWDAVRRALASTDAGFWIGTALELFGALMLFTLLFYADFALSQAFSKHRVLYHIMAVVIFIALLRLLFSVNGLLDHTLFRVSNSGGSAGIIGGADGPTAIFVRRDFGIELIELYLLDVGLYFLTWAALKLRPNIE